MSDEPANHELVRRAKSGDAEAFGLLYDRTARLVRAVAIDAGHDEADDVTHDTFLRAYRNLGSLRDPERFAVWLVGIARLVVRERRRGRRFQPLPDDVPTAGVANHDDHEELLQQVARLPEEQRHAIRFFFLNERSIDETARLLGRSRSGTYAVLQQARANLARWLRECGVRP